MADGIAKGVGEQLGELGKQIVHDVAKVPSQLVGLDSGGINESPGGSGPSGQQQKARIQNAKAQEAKRIADIAKKDEMQKQQQLARARQLLQQFIRPGERSPLSIKEKLEQDDLEKKKKQVEEERKKAAKALPKSSSKRPRGDLYGTRAKQFAGETGKNVKSQ